MIIFVIVTIIVYAWRCCGAKSSSIPEAEIKLYMPKTHCCFPPYDSPHSWQYLGRILGKLPSCQLVHGWGLVTLSVVSGRPASSLARTWRIIWDCSESA